jgi:hypothetical protein
MRSGSRRTSRRRRALRMARVLPLTINDLRRGRLITLQCDLDIARRVWFSIHYERDIWRADGCYGVPGGIENSDYAPAPRGAGGREYEKVMVVPQAQLGSSLPFVGEDRSPLGTKAAKNI